MIRYIATTVVVVAGVFTNVMATGAQGVGPVTFPTMVENHGTYLHLSGGTNYQPLPAGAPVPASASFHATRDGRGIVTTRNFHTMTASHQTALGSGAPSAGPEGGTGAGLLSVGAYLQPRNGVVQHRGYHLHMAPADCEAFRRAHAELGTVPCDMNMGVTLGVPQPGPAPLMSTARDGSRTARFSPFSRGLFSRSLNPHLQPLPHVKDGLVNGWYYNTAEVYLCYSGDGGCNVFYSRVYQYYAFNYFNVYAQAGTDCNQMSASVNMHITLISGTPGVQPNNWCGNQNSGGATSLTAGDNVHIWGTLPTPIGGISAIDFNTEQRMYLGVDGGVQVWQATSNLTTVGCWVDPSWGYCH